MGNGSEFHYSLKNNGKWIRIPLLIKKLVGNGFEFHYSIKK